MSEFEMANEYKELCTVADDMIEHPENKETFNAFGLSKRLIDKGKDYSDLVTNYRDAHDPISKLKSNIGKTYIVPSTLNTLMATTPFGWVHAHRISLMGDCRDSVSVETYKKEHFWFLNKISDAEITREDIGGMSRELFEIYEQDIMTRMNRGEIKSAYELENSGVIYVDDYYRDDGTFVQGYYRRLPREYA